MLAICDVNEYRKCVKDFNSPFVSQLFDTLHALCNLLLVVPDNLKQVCTGEQLVSYFSVDFVCTCLVPRATRHSALVLSMQKNYVTSTAKK